MSSSSSAMVVQVEKATSDLLIDPDWTLNMEICDSVNSAHWLAKDVMKAVKKRLQHKSPNVQFLALTLLETMIKNCGDFVHFQVVEREILQEMVKIVRKKTDMRVRDKILVLLDSWQEAFGGLGGKYPQYYLAYSELKSSGVQFPNRSPDSALIFTPPISHAKPVPIKPPIGYGIPSTSAVRLEEAMASEMANLSISDLGGMQSVMELLSDMLKAINPNDQRAVKDEVIIDLVIQCRSNQKKLRKLINFTRDEELLAKGLELNDNLQTLLAKHDAIDSGSPLPTETSQSFPGSSTSIVSPPVVTRVDYDEEEDEDDDFAQLARRNSKPCAADSNNTHLTTDHSSAETVGKFSTSPTASSTKDASSPRAANALVLADPPTPVRTATKEQDMIELLSITLSSNQSPPHSPLAPPSASNQTGLPSPLNSGEQGHLDNPLAYAGDQTYSYVAPWAVPQPHRSPPQPQSQPQYSYESSSYIPPPWDTAPASANHNPFVSSTYHIPPTFPSVHSSRPLQQNSSFGSRVDGVQATGTEAQTSSGIGQTMLTNAPKPYVYTNRLFNELMDLKNADGSLKSRNSSSSFTGFPS